MIMRYLLILFLSFFSISAFSQGIYNKAATNIKQNRLMADSVLGVPRDTSATNNATFNGAPVGDSGRIAFQFGKFWGHDGSGWNLLGSQSFDINDWIRNQSSIVQTANYRINGNGLVGNTMTIGSSAYSGIAPLYVSTLPSFGNLSAFFEGTIQADRASNSDELPTLGQLSDSIPNGPADYIPFFSSAQRLRTENIYYRVSPRPEFHGLREFVLGNKPFTTQSAKFMVSDTIIADSGYHSIGDYSYITQSGSGSGYAVFDIRTTFNSDGDWNHIYPIQIRPFLNGTGAVTGEFVGIKGTMNLFGTGIVDTSMFMHVQQPSGTNPINHNWGIRIGSFNKGTASNFGLINDAATLLGNPLHFTNVGTGAPTFTTRSAGAKILLWPSLSGTTVDYAFGMLGNAMWSSVPSNTSSFFFNWFGGTTQIASLDGTGKMYLGGSASASSTLQVNGSISLATRTVTATTSLGVSDYALYANNSGVDISINLPAAATCTGRIYVVKKIGNNANTVTIDPSGAELIDDAFTYVIGTYKAGITFQSDGTKWWIH